MILLTQLKMKICRINYWANTCISSAFNFMTYKIECHLVLNCRCSVLCFYVYVYDSRLSAIFATDAATCWSSSRAVSTRTAASECSCSSGFGQHLSGGITAVCQ